ncbi:MAG: MarR family winged helix-turn-helix transcriptional regulator [Janthinobacterium lividum]
MEASVDPDLFQTPGHLISRSSRLMLRWGEERFNALGLAPAQMPVLYALKDGASMTQKELATLVRIEQPTMAQLLARMERDGVIQRTAHPSDKRSSLVSLTPETLKKVPAVRSALRDANNAALRGFTDRESATLSRLLRRVVQNLEPDAPFGEVAAQAHPTR